MIRLVRGLKAGQSRWRSFAGLVASLVLGFGACSDLGPIFDLRVASPAVGLCDPDFAQRPVGVICPGDKKVMTPSNQAISDPADIGGARLGFTARLMDMAISADGRLLATVDALSTVRLYDATQDLASQAPRTLDGAGPRASYLGLAFNASGSELAVSEANRLRILDTNDLHTVAEFSPSSAPPLNSRTTGVTFDPNADSGDNLYLALDHANQIGFIDRTGPSVNQTWHPSGVAPLGLAVSKAQNGRPDRVFVANWGGRAAVDGDATAPSDGTPVVIDARGIASTGTVTVVDAEPPYTSWDIAVALHPSIIKITPDNNWAAVVNSNSDSVTFINTDDPDGTITPDDSPKVISVADSELGAGLSPTSLAFSPNDGGRYLYVALGGLNAIAVLQNRTPGAVNYSFQGYIPADWFPLAVEASANGRALYVANAKGLRGRWYGESPADGTLDQLPSATADGADLPAWTRMVRRANKPFSDTAPPVDSPADLSKLGIKYAFLIIKENQCYDSILGDMSTVFSDDSDGDNSRVQYGCNTPDYGGVGCISPNHHKLARTFVNLDNYYTVGAVSADAHHWLTQAASTDYSERSMSMWKFGPGRSYPYAGDDPLVFASTGFIWNQVSAAGGTVDIFGEYMNASGTLNVRTTDSAMWHGGPSYPGFSLTFKDNDRATTFINWFGSAVASPPFGDAGRIHLVILWLPRDHTGGFPPNGMVADNDQALGRIVEAISASPIWPRSAIFVTEDDAQLGLDHVDVHRTICLVASPYARRGYVEHTQYNHTSILATIEELLSIPAMNKFDKSALPMRSVFLTSADTAPYQHVEPNIATASVNPPLSSLKGAARLAALEESTWNLSKPDSFPEGRLRQIRWHQAKGWNKPYPGIRHSPNCPNEGGHTEDDD
ncbi:MAG TPA: bifunctional YncE family protein/alkaline phosphatase family protein [Myxococcaceae bacterium]|nr:bifunctional YncE family protein/alkaline phosphatase family protein [Myxococcaceae bacterium]